MKNSSVFDELKQRCLAAGLESEIVVLLPPQGTQQYLPGLEPKRLIIKMPKGRETKDVTISEKFAPILLNCHIEHCKFIRGYGAIWSETLNFIECEILSKFNMPRMLFHRISKILGFEESEDDQRRVELPSPKDGIQISIGIASVEHTIMLQRRGQNTTPQLNRKVSAVVTENECIHIGG